MLKKILLKIKHSFDHLFLRFHKVNISKNSHIKSPYEIKNGEYIHIGENVSIQAFSNLSCFDQYANHIYNPIIKIENNVFINRFLTILSAGEISIGHDTFIGSHVTITNENHGTIPSKTSFGLQPLEVKSVSIGNNCWIGDQSIILPGVTIGRYSIIGAGSVVTKSIPEYCLAVGNPAKIIKRWNNQSKKWENNSIEYGRIINEKKN